MSQLLGFLFLGFVASLVGMLGVLGYQGVHYLRFGTWEPIAATDFCAQHLQIQWCAFPQDWYGLHGILAYFNPAGLALTIFGGLLLVIGATVAAME